MDVFTCPLKKDMSSSEIASKKFPDTFAISVSPWLKSVFISISTADKTGNKNKNKNTKITNNLFMIY